MRPIVRVFSSMLSKPIRLALAFLVGGFACQSHAETLVYVTANTIGNINSASPSVDATSGGPLSYTLPSNYQGYKVVGAAADAPDVPNMIFLLTQTHDVNGGPRCQLFSIDLTKVIGDKVTAAPDGSDYYCYEQMNDFSFFSSGSAGTDASQNQEYLASSGSILIDANPVIATDVDYPVRGSFQTMSGAAGNVIALGIDDPGDGGTIYGIDATSVSLFASTDDNVNQDTKVITEANVHPLGLTLSAPISLDFSRATSTLYFLNGGSLYTASIGSTPVLLGSVPAGTLSVIAGVNVPATANCPVATSSSISVTAPNGSQIVFTTTVGLITACPVPTPAGASSQLATPAGFFNFTVTGLSAGQSFNVRLDVPDGSSLQGIEACSTADSCAVISTPCSTGSPCPDGTTRESFLGGSTGTSSVVAPFGVITSNGAPNTSGGSSSSSDGDSGGGGGGAFGLLTLIPLLGFAGMRHRRKL
jgi:hypothetical protein